MRMLVTGNKGQVVTALQERLISHPSIEFQSVGRPEIDLDQPDTIADKIVALKPDIVVSAAAWTAVDDAQDNVEAAFRANAYSAGQLAHGAAKIGAPIIHLSTDYVFDGSKPSPWNEEDKVSPLGVYGASKLQGEELVASANENHIILRTAWVYSPWGKNFVKTMLELAKTHDELSIVNDQFGYPTSALDLADAIIRVTKSITRLPIAHKAGIYHLAGKGKASWCDLASEIFHQSATLGGPTAKAIPVNSASFPTKAKRPTNSCLDCTKFEQTFEFHTRPWQTALNETITRLLTSY